MNMDATIAVVKDRQERLDHGLKELERRMDEKVQDHDMRIRKLELALAKVAVIVVVGSGLLSALASALMSWALNRL